MAGRVSQAPTEVLVQPTDVVARVSQAPTEVLVQPTDVAARVSQSSAEVLVQPTDVVARVSQSSAEVLFLPTLEIAVPAAVITLTAPPPDVGVVIEVPAAVVTITAGPVLLPLKFVELFFDVGGIGTWEHTRPFDIERDPLAFSHARPFDLGTAIGYEHSNPFDIEGLLKITHERPFAISGAGAEPKVGSHLPLLKPIAQLVLTAPTDGTTILNVADTTGVEVGMTATIGIYTATILAVTPTTITLDRTIP